MLQRRQGGGLPAEAATDFWRCVGERSPRSPPPGGGGVAFAATRGTVGLTYIPRPRFSLRKQGNLGERTKRTKRTKKGGCRCLVGEVTLALGECGEGCRRLKTAFGGSAGARRAPEKGCWSYVPLLSRSYWPERRAIGSPPPPSSAPLQLEVCRNCRKKGGEWEVEAGSSCESALPRGREGWELLRKRSPAVDADWATEFCFWSAPDRGKLGFGLFRPGLGGHRPWPARQNSLVASTCTALSGLTIRAYPSVPPGVANLGRDSILKSENPYNFAFCSKMKKAQGKGFGPLKRCLALAVRQPRARRRRPRRRSAAGAWGTSRARRARDAG